MQQEGRRRPPVIADVARAAGVSVPTVSRVLNGTLPVSDHKREQVLRAVRELGYRPNGAARALVTGRQSMITIITSNTTRHGYAMTIQGIEEAARAAGYLVAIAVLDSGAGQTIAAALDLVLGQPTAGVIVLDFDEIGGRAISAVPDTVALAAVSSTTEGRVIPRVLFDDMRGGWDATRYLLSLGHRTVHHVALPESGRPNGRLLGWRRALQESGAEVPEVIRTDWSPASGYRAGLVLAGMDDVTAVLCGNDEVAFTVMKGLKDAGRAIPDDVSVIGFDDQPLAAFWSPPLTTMGADFVQLGREAATLLFASINESIAASTAVSAELHLVVRASTGPPPGQPAPPAS
ncbi:MAG TPA: LacI family DNA-binding transcriptional regulator [Actinoplanes sp.]